MIKPIIYLVLIIAVTAVGAIQYFGDGLFAYKTKAYAEQIVAESRDIEEASDAYALNYGDGEVHYGDPDHPDVPEELFKYLYEKNLLLRSAGQDTEEIAWEVNEDGTGLQIVLDDDTICKYINLNKHQWPLHEDTPECDDNPDELSCCEQPAD